jgi:hypothetical protein
MSEPLTLSVLCGIEGQASGFPVTKEERDKLVQAMKERAAFEGLSAFDIGERLLDFVGESLRKPVAGILEQVWSQRKELREIAAKGNDKRDVEAKVDLYPHTISYTLRPSVQLQVGGVDIGPTMTFDATAKLKLEGLQLVIKNAWIIQIRAGMLTSTLNLQYKGIPLMAPCKKQIDLPIHLKLPKGGIRLGGETTPPPLTPEPKKE